jgi:NTP pyrophosphatase (non-canonical NTP hydrolase)
MERIRSLNDYQLLAEGFAKYPRRCGVDYCIHGLTSEAGEVAGKWKKVLRDDDGELSDEVRTAILHEIGDVLWYVSQLAVELQATLGAVASMNIAKLEDRKNRGVLGGSGDNR